MAEQTTSASQVYRLETDRPRTLRGSFLSLVPLWRPDWGHAGVSIVRKSDAKIVRIINDDSYDSQTVTARLEADIVAMTAFEFEQAWGVNTAR